MKHSTYTIPINIIFDGMYKEPIIFHPWKCFHFWFLHRYELQEWILKYTVTTKEVKKEGFTSSQGFRGSLNSDKETFPSYFLISVCRMPFSLFTIKTKSWIMNLSLNLHSFHVHNWSQKYYFAFLWKHANVANVDIHTHLYIFVHTCAYTHIQIHIIYAILSSEISVKILISLTIPYSTRMQTQTYTHR